MRGMRLEDFESKMSCVSVLVSEMNGIMGWNLAMSTVANVLKFAGFNGIPNSLVDGFMLGNEQEKSLSKEIAEKSYAFATKDKEEPAE